jgi:hypothetical protein
MNYAFVRTEPAILRVVGNAPLPTAKIGHNLFDVAARKTLRKVFGRLANQLVAITKRKCQADSAMPIAALKQSYRVRIDGMAMHRVRSYAIGKRVSGIEYAGTLDHD